MGPSDRDSSAFERRSSGRRSSRQSETAPESDHDDYDLSATAVSDGFRPAANGIGSAPSSYQPTPQTTTFSTNLARPPQPASGAVSKNVPNMANRPSSTAKPPRPHDSLTLRNDGSNAARPGQSSVAMLSDAPTDGPRTRPENSFQGTASSSHPYELVPRVNTDHGSTATHAADGPHGPTHPYTLYPQNIAPAEESIQEHIPLGFAGAGSNYQRQLGPDGEEAGDLIGPMGHLEELPPYTRYPEQSYARKASVEAGQTVSAAPVRAIPGAGGLGVATRNPEFSSTDEDLAMSRSRPSTRSVNSTVSQHDINTAARDMAEKPTPSKWQRRAKRRMCGIVPYWAICLLTVGLIVMGIIMGAVIGTLLSRHENADTDEDYDAGNNVPTTTSVDVEPIPTLPTDLAGLETGSFALPPLEPSNTALTCFDDTTQSKSWSCDMPFHYYSMDVDYLPDASAVQSYNLSLTSINVTGARFIWGMQPPVVPEPMSLSLVKDSFQEGYGPAWWLSFSYNKTVIVAEEDFNRKTSKRNWHYSDPPVVDFGPSQLKKKTIGAKEGDTPWICTWPDTTIEIFIYPNQNSSLASTSTSTSVDYDAPTTTSSSYAAKTEDSSNLSAYPQVVKFVELRMSNDPESTAICQQVEIINNGQDMKPLLDDHHNPIEIAIVEKVTSPEEDLEQRQRDRHATKRDHSNTLASREALELTDCGCLWLLT